MRRIAAAALLLLAATPAARAQQEACKMEMNVPALTLADMYAKSEKAAKAWQADAVPARITNTSLGPLDEKGKSTAWNLMFYSKSANSSVTIQVFNGMFSCYAMPGDAGRLPALRPDFFRDGAKLYAIAKEKGGNFLAQGYSVSVGTAAAPSTNHATWNIQYSKPDGKTAPRLVLVDANTGALEKVID